MKIQIIDRLSRYVKIDTQSNPESKSTPSTEKQWDLLHLLQKELQDFGLETELDNNGYLFATLESNIERSSYGRFLSTCRYITDFNATNVNPQIIKIMMVNLLN